jgi:hypothetical protein
VTHTCHAHNCKTVVQPRMFVCRTHWAALRQIVKNAVWREYRDGQEVRKDPTPRYLAVQRRAVAELAFKPNDEEAAQIAAAYLWESEKWRRVAIEMGQGDPLTGLEDGSPMQ